MSESAAGKPAPNRPKAPTGGRRVCIVTGSRAEYGLLQPLLKEVQAAPGLELQLVVTGMHLSPEFGLTYREIEGDGFTIDAKVEMLLSSDSPAGIAKSIGLGVIGFSDALQRLHPDLLLLLGDRFEILAAAQAAMVARIPIAHLCGGDTTEGAIDEAIRHSLTKMSHLHFVTNAEAASRVRQMGESPAHVYNVGSTGLDRIRQLTLLQRGELERRLKFPFRQRNLLVTFHPATLDEPSPQQQMQELLAALDRLGPQVGLLFTLPNADAGGRRLIEMVNDFASVREHARVYDSLGQLLYLSTMDQVDAVVGNSSSGLYEAPSFKKPTVNIGDRQKGRLQADSVINAPPVADAIFEALQEAFGIDCSSVVNPYGDGKSAARIVSVLKEVALDRGLLRKSFHRHGESA